jgi:lactate dehydrogenase-like 2-hydroxyacid dehydrogenase
MHLLLHIFQLLQYYLLSGKDVFNSTIGIYGMGDIGKAFARRLQGFNTANNVSKETYVALKSASASLCLDRL